MIRFPGTIPFLFVLCALSVRAEVMLQYFETDWDEMYRRMPEISEIGYDFIWTPPPTKGPTGKGTKWSNVGYNLYDRFDLGDMPQRGSLATRYGTRGDLRNMVDAAHRCDVKIIPDIVMNHNGNGPDFREYPGMVPEDFHVQWWQGYYNTLNYRRGPRMYQWSPDNGYGGTMWQELANLIDIRTEDNFDSGRFTGGNSTPGYNLVSGTSFLRHPAQYDKYPYFPAGYGNENAPTMLNRWIAWLGNAIDYDGLRIDAAKHTPWDFFGARGSGFLHEAQYNFNLRRGFTDGNADEADHLFTNYIRRNDALIFAEILSYPTELEYWFGGNLYNLANNTRNPMRFLDYPGHQTVLDAINGGNLARLHLGGDALDPQVGIEYCWGHDDDSGYKRPSKPVLAYAYLLTHVGLPMIYTTGNNLAWSDSGRSAYPGSRTWMVPGFDSHALGDLSGDLVNLIWVHQQFARGREWERWSEGDFFAYERYDDLNGNSQPDLNEGLMLVALNDSGSDQTRNNVTVSFAVGTVLHDYTGRNATDITVYNNGGLSQVNLTVPANGGQGYVCYAPKIADAVSMSFSQGGSPAPTMTWIVPGGDHAASKTRQVPRITGQNLRVQTAFNPAGGAVDSVMLKWGRGDRKLTAGNYWDTNNLSLVSARFESCNQGSTTNWYMDIDVDAAGLPEGLNVVKARVFNQMPAGHPARFNTATKVVYVDRHGPELNIEYPAEGQTVNGDCVMIIRNPDSTAYGMTVAVNGATNTAHEIMKGLWKYSLVGIPAGPQTITVTATEADWASPRNVINTSTVSRAVTFAANPNPISLSVADGSTKQTEFFRASVTAPGAGVARLFWDGYELPFNGGGLTNIFNGEVIFRDYLSNVVTDRLWGAFVNGQHFFEAVRVDGGVTSRAVARVTFNLYGINAIDSDGDSLPDNVEIPYFDDGAPGGDQPLPGDDAGNPDFIPKDENWTRLNPYNQSTFYLGQWDDQLDSDGDGYSNGAEVLAGYAEGSIYKYSIFDSSSHPSGTPVTPSAAQWAPGMAARGQTVQVTYTPNSGPLSGAATVYLHVGHSARTLGTWQDVADQAMNWNGTNWTAQYSVPTNATSVDFVFFDGTTTWDNNSGSDWRILMQASTNRYFSMDGLFDSEGYTIFPAGTGLMKIQAAVKGENLYIATHAAGGGGNDHFLYVTDEPGDKADPAPGWNKAGKVFFNTATKPYLTGEGAVDSHGFCVWNHAPAGVSSNGPTALEGEINLADVFGRVPDAVYVAAVAYQTADGGGIVGQGPYKWDSNNDVEITEFLRVPVSSIRDEDRDGNFDAGSPQMWTVVGGNTNDANYGLRRTFLNELAGEETPLTVILRPNAGGTNQVSDAELFSNINRRDFAVIEEDPGAVTTNSDLTYYRAYAMTNNLDGTWSYTIRVRKCGAYRINARYRVNNGPYVYYTDNGLRRDCAVVASPRKVFDARIYELNPMVAEATNDQFAGRSTFRDMVLANTDRPDVINTNHFASIGMNMVWLQPIHPIGTVNRETDPATAQPYEPGSPYAVRNYWQVNPALGASNDTASALTEFQQFIAALDTAGVGVMLDGTFNHSAWDCQIGEEGVALGVASDPNGLIRDVRPQWYSRASDYGSYAEASYDIAPAPDRFDFGKWSDAADFFFGQYDCLVQGLPADTNNTASSAWHDRYLLEEDRMEPVGAYTRELWEYFARYPTYWLEKTGHPAGTPPSQSYKGIDGLRCDFAQGLPSRFWEYCINKTRSVKWDFLFMAESLDGYREVAGSKRHGVGYRSSRHFDILNENIVFYWRNNFFAYPYQGSGGDNWGRTPAPYTDPTRVAFDDRRNAFDASPLLLNLSSHDEVYPSNDPWKILYAFAQVSAMDGVPMLLYGQEAGAKNNADVYSFAGYGALPTKASNFERYETNFGKSIPNFKRFNCMTNVWAHRDWTLQNLYSRIGAARRQSAALRSQGAYFLSRTGGQGYDSNMFAVAKFEQPGVSAATQDVVFAFVNNDYWGSENRWATFDLSPTYNGKNWFGIESGRSYNVVDLLSTNPAQYIWATNRVGSDLLASGMTVGLTGSAVQGGQAQYLKLVDVSSSYPDTDGDGIPDFTDWDDDNDGLSDDWENANGTDPHSAAGNNGADGDKDNDGVSNEDEMLAGTRANQSADVLRIFVFGATGGLVNVEWPTVRDRNYAVESSPLFGVGGPDWSRVTDFRTALSAQDRHSESIPPATSNRMYRVVVQP
jgi:glycosidase